MRGFFALFVVVLLAVGCGADNSTVPGHTGVPSRVSLDSDGSDDGDTAALDMMPASFDNPLSSFDFNTIDGGLEIKPDEVRDPESADPIAPSGEVGGSDDLEPEIIPDDDPDSGDTPDPDDEPDSDDDLEPEVVGGDGDDPDSGPDDADEFGLEVVE